MIPLDEFWNKLNATWVSWEPLDHQTTTFAGGGSAYGVQRGEPVFSGSIDLRRLTRNDNTGIRALCEFVRNRKQTFLVTPKHRINTHLPDSCEITALSTANLPGATAHYHQLDLAGLQDGHTINADDFLSIWDGSRHLMYRVMIGGAASDGTVQVGLSGKLHPTVTVGQEVRLKVPVCAAVMTDYRQGGFGPALDEGQRFSWRQVY